MNKKIISKTLDALVNQLRKQNDMIQVAIKSMGIENFRETMRLHEVDSEQVDVGQCMKIAEDAKGELNG